MGIQLTAQQRRQIEKAVHEKELAEDGSTGESESTEAAETPVETGPKLFDLKLAAFDAKAKIKVIKEVRSILGLGLKEAKELVESAPVNLQKGVKEADAEAFKAKLQEAGATIELVPST
jgi:large subunit ribosomal protein L7/L12